MIWILWGCIVSVYSGHRAILEKQTEVEQSTAVAAEKRFLVTYKIYPYAKVSILYRKMYSCDTVAPRHDENMFVKRTLTYIFLPVHIRAFLYFHAGTSFILYLSFI